MARLSTDPIKDINLRLSLEWVSDVWFSEFKKQTIVNCWEKSTILKGVVAIGDSLPIINVLSNIRTLYDRAARVTCIRDKMELS